MEQLLELILGGGLRLSLFDSDLLALDRELPRSDMLALLMLQRRGEATMSELAADLAAPLSTATGIGERLVRRGLAQRERHAGDRRVILVRLTSAGHDLAIRSRASITRLIGRLQSALTPTEIAQLLVIVPKVLAALQGSGGGPTQESGARGARRIPVE